jgi:hypothetical protein
MKEQKDMAFADEEYGLVDSGIVVSVPSFKTGRVFQPALNSESHPVVRAVALADIGTAGMEPKVFGTEGELLFIEQEIEIIEAIRKAKNPDDIKPEKQELYLKRYRSWMNIQVGFAEGRKTLLEGELGNLDDKSKKRVRKLFSGFPESIRIATKNAKAADGYSFEQMARRLVPKAFSSNA